MNKLQFTILMDMQKNKPLGIWVWDTTIKFFEHAYKDEYDEEQSYFYGIIDKVDFDSVNMREFWNYWLSQGGHSIYFAGVYEMDSDVNGVVFTKDVMEDMDKFVAKIKRDKMKPIEPMQKGV